jgi:hypothetical protein
MANELELLTFVNDVLTKNPNIKLKDGADSIKLSQRIAQQYDFKDGQLFDKRTQQAVNVGPEYIMFNLGKENGMLEVKNMAAFNRKYSHGFTSIQMENAQKVTREALHDFVKKNSYVLKSENHGSDEALKHVVSRMVDHEKFIAESSNDGDGIVLRQVKEGGYFSLNQFSVKEIFEQLAKGMIDEDLTEIRRLEVETALQDKAIKLAGKYFDPESRTYKHDEAKTQRLLTTLKREHFAQRIQKRLPVANVHELEMEFKNEILHREALIEAALNVHQIRQMHSEVQTRIDDLRKPSIANRPTLAEYEDRYRNYGRVTDGY